MKHAVKEGERYVTFDDWANAVVRSMCCARCYGTMVRNLAVGSEPK